MKKRLPELFDVDAFQPGEVHIQETSCGVHPRP